MRSFFVSSIAVLSALTPTGAAAAVSESAEPFTASRDPAAYERSLDCLTQAIYYEARSQSDDGERAVAQVVLNRVRHPAFPNSVCGVVYQGSQRGTGCQFTFTCDGSMNRAVEPYAWARARRIAEAALHGDVYRPVGLATNYHTTAIHPYWAPTLIPQAIVGAHIFYRMPGSATLDAFSQAPSADEPDAAAAVRFASPRLDLPRTMRGVRVRYAAAPQMEIPVVERPVVYRALGGGATPAMARGGPARAAARPAVMRASSPRISYEGGVRIFRGS
jgi:hypothetical protein